jgi:hypothetical protein
LVVSSDFSAQPLFSPVAPLLDELLHGGDLPDVSALNRRAAAAALTCGSGKELSFVVPGGCGLPYEERIYWLGEVETRPSNWHDFLNALVWLTFPRTKSVLNARHHAARAALQAAGRSERGPLRDALTQFDECGAVLVSNDLSMWEDIRQHRWKELFWRRRQEAIERLRLFVFGHASYDTLRMPHIGVCAKAVFVHVDSDWVGQPVATQIADVDARLAQRFSGYLYARPRDFAPLPLLGVPGATPDNEFPAYYDDTRQFRPLRAVR